MLHKELRDEIGHCIVPLGGQRRVFSVVRPRTDGGLAEQTADVLRTLKTFYQGNGGLDSLVMLSFFLRNDEDLPVCRRLVEDFFGRSQPATAYAVQPPCDGSLLNVEAWGVASNDGEMRIERIDNRMVVVRHDGCDWAYLADIRAETNGSVADCSLRAFQLADRRLERAGLRFGDVVRTWLYLGDITGMEGDAPRYHGLNHARTEFYRDRTFGDGMVSCPKNVRVFPASTGIGTGGDDVAIGCIALRTTRSDVSWIPLENPRQTASCDYGMTYGPDSPKFARAMAVVTGKFAMTFISGTASITDSETQHTDDVAWQTRQTLDNIETLIAGDNFRRHGLAGQGATLDDLALARVYVKRPADFAAVKEICLARLGPLPIVYVVGDICRPELLVEIEGIAFSGR